MEKTQKNKGGRPKIVFDLKDLAGLARLQCTYQEVAAFFECNTETIERRMKDDEEFCAVYKKGIDQGKMSLRRKMYEAAVNEGNTTMQIWLSKQYLGFADKKELGGMDGKDMIINVNIIKDDE